MHKNHRKYTKQEEDFIRLNYTKYGADYCGKSLARTPVCIGQKANRMGIYFSKEETKVLAIKARERSDEYYDVNPSVFREVASAESAYLLGYIWADGYVYAGNRPARGGAYIIRLDIVQKDYLCIKDVLEKTGDWTVDLRKKQKESHQSQVGIRTGNKPLVVYLDSKGYGDKSRIAPSLILDMIPDHLKHYWWRGYFDGDGCFFLGPRACAFSFAGSLDQDWKEHESLLKSIGVSYRINQVRTSRGNSSNITCQNREGVFRLGQYIYKNYNEDLIGLPRKHEKWLKVKEKHDFYQELENLKIEAPKDLLNLPHVVLCVFDRYSGKITRKRLIETFDTSLPRFTRIIRDLIALGFIKGSGSTSKRIFSITETGRLAAQGLRDKLGGFLDLDRKSLGNELKS